jgi:hypothetical protein
MNRDILKKLNGIIRKRWCETTEKWSREAPLADNGRHIIKAHVRWREICDSLGIERLKQMGEDEFHQGGEILEESIVLMDPALYGAWLDIPNETAEKILVMGMP